LQSNKKANEGTSPSSSIQPTIALTSHVASSQPQHDDITHTKVDESQLANQLDNYVLEIQPYVVSIDQLPSIITHVVKKTGKTNTSAMLTCKMQDGDLCIIPQRQLLTIIGDVALKQLLSDFAAQPK
jgi:hypothetical protein